MRGGGGHGGGGRRVDDEPDDTRPRPLSDVRLLRRFAPFLRPHWRLVALALGTLAVSMPFVVVTPHLIRLAVDGPIRAPDLQGLAPLLAMLLGALTLEFGLRAAHQWSLQALGQGVMSDVRRTAFRKVLDLSPGYFDRTPTGWLVTRLTSDIETMNQLLTQGIVITLSDCVALVVIAGYLLASETGLALTMLATTPLMIGVMLRFRPRAREVHRRARTALARITAHLHESCAGIRAVKALRAEPLARTEMERRLAEYRSANLDAVRLYALFFPSVEACSMGAMALLVWASGRAVLGGALTTGEFVAFWFLAGRFFEPIRQLTQRSGVLQAALAGAERLAAVLDEVPVIRDPATLAPEPPRQGAIEFQGVSFAYRPDAPVLQDVSFRVEPGQTVALVGATGAGKSTVLSLVARFYDPTGGSVRLDGVDLRAMPTAAVRGRIAYAPQDPVLVGETLGAAVGLDGPGGDAAAEGALRALGADDLLARLPDGMRSRLAERGENLSAGERQICALARALVADAPVLLLDEALSQVDPESEARALAALRGGAGGRAVLVAAHRLATIQGADRILVFHRGRLTEQGTHGELLAQDGIYRRLYELQRLDALLANGARAGA